MNQDDLDVLAHIFGSENVFVFDEAENKMTGIVVKAFADKKFGFIKGTDEVQYFFHQSDLSGFWDDLIEDVDRGLQIQVNFEIAQSTKGPRAANVSRLDSGAPLPTS